jgi:membrane-bound lytic murein transglycosylase B
VQTRCAVILLLVLTTCALTAQAPDAPPPAPAPAPTPEREPFPEWRERLIADARARGIAEHVITDTLAGIEPLEHVIASDRTQAELTPGLDRYLKSRVTPAVVRRGRALAREHRTLLTRLTRTYGVPGSIVQAIWGVESRFGRATGRVPIIPALATLAWEGRRAEFFRGQLFDALTGLDRGYIDPSAMRGSWAGAMGQPQFMPSSYLQYAVDFDGDGRRDIWQSTPDALASIANYLSQFGWQRGQSWGREVRVPSAKREAIAEAVPKRAEGCYALRNMTERRPLSRWRALGVTRMDGKPLSIQGPDAALVDTGTRQFLVTASYDAILGYNCAHYYALSVGLLANRLR